MAEDIDAMTEESELDHIGATVDVDDVVFALKMNATNRSDDRVIAVPQRDGAQAKVRRAFRGSERYSNPSSAPVHIWPEALVEDAWNSPPRRVDVDTTYMPVPELAEDRDEDDEGLIDEAHDVLVDDWETDVRGMIKNTHEFQAKGCKIELTGVEEEE